MSTTYSTAYDKYANITDVPTQSLPLDEQRHKWISQAVGTIDSSAITSLLAGIVNIPSPSGSERELAEYLVACYRKFGINGRYQAIDEKQGNAIGRLPGSGGGAALMLYSMIDTPFTGNEEIFRTYLDSPDWGIPAIVENGIVIGHGAENPKAYIICELLAAKAIVDAGIPLNGDLILAHCAGGIPSNARDNSGRQNIAQGIGCSYLLEQGIHTDYAVICKPGWAVAWEEVGVAWFKVTVAGKMQYTGVRQFPHYSIYRNSILDAIPVLEGLEKWFANTYNSRNTSGLCAPQGSIGAIQGGFPYMPIFTPPAVEIYIDLRISPRTPPLEVQRQLEECLDEIRAGHPGLDIRCEPTLLLPGASTDPGEWIVQSGMRAWEWLESKPHQAILNTAGVTDASILRNRGIRTARIGMPPPTKPIPAYSGISMGFADSSSMLQLIKLLIYCIVDTCTRTPEEINRITRLIGEDA